jgi:hypothetical protein
MIPHEFVVAFGDAKNFVYWCHPFTGNFFLSNDAAENLANRIPEARGPGEQDVSGLRITLREKEQLGASFWRYNSRGFEETDQILPIACA